MWEINEGGNRLLYAMKLLPSKDFRKYCSSWDYSLKMPALFILGVFTNKHVFAYECFFLYQSTRTLEHALIFSKCMVDEHVFVNLVSLNKNFSPY